MSTCDLGLMKAGRLAVFVALSNILDILLVFVNNAEYVTEKLNPTPNLCKAHIQYEGSKSSKNVMP